MGIGAVTAVVGVVAGVLAGILARDQRPTPLSAGLVDTYAAAIFVGLISYPLLLRRRDAMVEAVRRADAEARLQEYSDRERADERRVAAARRRVRGCLTGDGMGVLFQPIVSTKDGRVLGFEALARFGDGRRPDTWFAEAAAVGLGVELEIRAMQVALDAATCLPDGVYLALNVSAATLTATDLGPLLAASGRDVVIELTEHARIDDYDLVLQALAPLRAARIRLAADDAGNGYAGFAHLVRLGPDMIKLDRDLIRGIDTDPAKRALASAVTDFGAEIGAEIVAEGVETENELHVLVAVGVGSVQGYLLGRPQPLPSTVPEFADLRSPTVLLVDDDPAVCTMATAALQKGGFRVVGEAADAREALDAARRLQPEVIVLDVGLPTMSGDQLLPLLRGVAPSAAIVVLSAATDAIPAARARELADWFVWKGDPLSDLAPVVRRTLAALRSPTTRVVDLDAGQAGDRERQDG